jgi:hypothetical protein
MVEQRRSVRNAAQRFQVRALGQCAQPDSLLPRVLPSLLTDATYLHTHPN